jgi:arylsulfatase A-like enzyme
MMLSRRELLTAAASAAALAAQTKQRPNVVVLYTDDQRFDTIRAWGNRDIQTPNLDRLARNGCSFTHTFTQGGPHGAICVPSRAMLMSGRSMFHVCRDILAKNAPQTYPPFPRVLGDAGYQTFMSGKWHNGPEYFAKAWTQNAENIFFGGMSDQFKIEAQDFDPSGKYHAKQRARLVKDTYASTLFADSALRFLGARDKSKPYLLYVPFTSPHDPRTAPKRFHEMYAADKMKLPPNFKPEHPFDNGDLKVRDEMLAGFPRKPEEVKQHLAEYYAMVTAVDHEIGRILDAIDLSNTFVFFAGDNGLALGQHGLFGKQNLYDHSWRVPMIAMGPGIPKGKRVQSLVHIFDICPTIYDVTGVAPPQGIEMQSLKPLWSGTGKPRDFVFAGYRNFQRAIRTDRWKLIEYNVNGKRTTQLFDLNTDPWEIRDLSADRQHKPKLEEMRQWLRAEMKRLDDPADLDAAEWRTV